MPDEAWESDDCVRRTVVMPAVLAERLAARAEQRGLSISDLLTEYAEEGLRRDGAAQPAVEAPVSSAASGRPFGGGLAWANLG